MKRKPLSPKTRYEVFKRDSFKCQYCGQSAPDVLLEVDHIDPVFLGGDNEMVNLTTACKECNRGKGPRALDDNSAVKVQQKQLQEIGEKRAQMEMMLDWRKSLSDLMGEQVHQVEMRFNAAFDGSVVSDVGRTKIRKWIKKYGLARILDAASEAIDQNIDDVFELTPKIASVMDKTERDPWFPRALYTRGILRKRFRLRPSDGKHYLDVIGDAASAGVDIEEIVDAAKLVDDLADFESTLNEMRLEPVR